MATNVNVKFDSVSTELGNFVVTTKVNEDSLEMILARVSFGDNKYGTAAFFTGDDILSSVEEFADWSEVWYGKFVAGEVSSSNPRFTARQALWSKTFDQALENHEGLMDSIKLDPKKYLAGIRPEDYMKDAYVDITDDFPAFFEKLLDETFEASKACGCDTCKTFTGEDE